MLAAAAAVTTNNNNNSIVAKYHFNSNNKDCRSDSQFYFQIIKIKFIDNQDQKKGLKIPVKYVNLLPLEF